CAPPRSPRSTPRPTPPSPHGWCAAPRCATGTGRTKGSTGRGTCAPGRGSRTSTTGSWSCRTTPTSSPSWTRTAARQTPFRSPPARAAAASSTTRGATSITSSTSKRCSSPPTRMASRCWSRSDRGRRRSVSASSSRAGVMLQGRRSRSTTRRRSTPPSAPTPTSHPASSTWRVPSTWMASCDCSRAGTERPATDGAPRARSRGRPSARIWFTVGRPRARRARSVTCWAISTGWRSASPTAR
ncbi:MAG: hypothetical protein AVDCRST_MAG11-300, partial [uncultured Gemmatimonadaceae bacterium]